MVPISESDILVQEDSVIMNQSAIDRGLFRSFFFRSYRDEEKRIGWSQMTERLEKPSRDETAALKHGSYDKLDDDGLAPPGTKCVGGDIIIGKTTPLEEDPTRPRIKKKDSSTPLRHSETGTVDQVRSW